VVSSLFDLLPAAVLARDLLGGTFPIVAIEQVHPLDFFRHEVDLLPEARENYPRVLADAYRRTDRVIAVSAAIRGVLRTAFGVPAARLAHVPNGVETDRLAPDGPRAARFTIAGMGRLHPLKRYDLLLRGAHAARARTGAAADVLLLGQGPERDALAALGRELGLEAGLTLAGFTPEPWDQLGRAHVLVHPSATEALPVAVLEAMALGLPVVATRWPGVEEVVEDGVNGFVVDDTPEAIGRSVALLQEDAALRARMGAAARAHSLRFDLRSVVLPAYRRELASLAPRARPLPAGFDLSLARWLDGRRADVRLVRHRDREAPALAAVRSLVFEDAVNVPAPASERYLLYTRQWPGMVERWVRDGGPAVLARCAWLHCP